MRLRVRFAKAGKVRFTSHRDVARMWERALRRAGVAVAYSVGFSPRPRLSFGLALPTGYESDAEYLDVELDEEVDPEEMPGLVDPHLPVGVDAQAAVTIGPGTPSLQQDVVSCSWQLALAGLDPSAARTRVAEVLALDELIATRTRKGTTSTDDLRPGILALAVAPAPSASGDAVVLAELTSRARTLRPSELVEAAWPGVEVALGRRTHQWIERDGARGEPIELSDGATDALHARRRAS